MTKTVIVEDNHAYREELTGTVNRIDGFEVAADFDNMEALLDYLKNNHTINLCLLDIGLPGMSGIEGIREILTIAPSMKIAMISVFDDEKQVFSALKNGACGYLLKGEVENRLDMALREIMAGGSFFTPSIASLVLKYFRNKPFSKIKLTQREKDVLIQLKEGLPKKQIAEKLSIAYGTVDTHVKNIYKKLHVKCGVQAVMKAVEEGIV